MKMLTGYLEPSAGDIRICGHDITRDKLLPAQSRIGYLPENCPVYPDMTVIDFLNYSAELRGLQGVKRDSALLRTIAQTELEEKAMELIATLSRGFRQRVGVAQALLHQPEVVILDEPTNGLDPSQIGHMRELIRDLKSEATVIVSTHILQEVEAVCDRVLILNRGRLALDASLEDLTRGRGLLMRCSGAATEVSAALRTLPQIEQVELLACGERASSYLLKGREDEWHFAPQIATFVVARGWQLYELKQEERTLEKVFLELSASAQEVPHAA